MQYLLGATKNYEIVFAEFGISIHGDECRVTSTITTQRCYSRPV